MSKKIFSIMAIIACCVFAFTGCSSTKALAMDNSNYKTSNGGNVVETNDYVYFINGVESYSTTYKTGEVTKGALMRTKTTNLDKLSELTSDDYETVVSKLIVSGDTNAGFYIYGDYVYYAVPSTSKDKEGELKSSMLNFFRTKLDGTNTSKNLVSEDYSSSTQFRFIENDGNVFLAIYSTGLYIYDASNGNLIFETEEDLTIDELMFDKENAGNVIYYTTKPINEELYDKDDENAKAVAYQDVHKVTVAKETTDELVLRGAGKYTIGSADGTQFGSVGATFDLIRLTSETLYFTYTSLDTTIASATYVALANDDLTVDLKVSATNVQNKQNAISTGLSNVASIFADTSLFVATDNIIYLDTVYGLASYDYTAVSDSTTNFGSKRIYYSETLIASTISSYIDGYLYYYTSDSLYYRLNLDEVIAGEEAVETRINALSVSTSLYKAEIITANDKTYFVANYSDATYYSYSYIIDVTTLEADIVEANELDDAELLDEDKTHFDDLYTIETTSEFVTKTVGTILGVMSEDDKLAFDEIVADLIEAEEEAED